MTRLSVFPTSKCPALSCTPFENQSSQVQLMTLKVAYFSYHSVNECESAMDIE